MGSYRIIIPVIASILILFPLVLEENAFATKNISDDSTGGDCNLIGVWDLITKTCVLTMDLNEEIKVNSNDIVLDGNFHILTGNGFLPSGGSGPAGITVSSSGVTVKNFVVTNFLTGILFTGDNNVSIHNVIDSNFSGFMISGQGTLGGFNTFKQNTISNSANRSFQLVNTNGNQVYENNFLSNDQKGFISNSHNNTFFLASPLGGNYYENEGLANQLVCSVIEGLFCVSDVMVFGTDSVSGLPVLDSRPYASMIVWDSPPDLLCGDNIVNHASEQCDDGNLIDDDGCTNLCQFITCGEGAVFSNGQCEVDPDITQQIFDLEAFIVELQNIIAELEALLGIHAPFTEGECDEIKATVAQKESDGKKVPSKLSSNFDTCIKLYGE